MKKIYLPFLSLAILFLFMLPSGAQTRTNEIDLILPVNQFQSPKKGYAFRIAAVVKPSIEKHFTFTSGSWLLTSFITKTYNSNGQITKAYEDRQQMVDFSTTYAYDEKGNKTEELSYQGNQNNQVFYSGYKSVYTYDASGNLTEEIKQSSRDGISWSNYTKRTYTYSNATNLFSGYVGYNFKNGNWEKSKEYKNVVWNSSGGIASLTLYYYTNNMEDGIERITSSPEGITLYESFKDNIWVYNDRFTNYTDANGNKAGYKYERYINGVWVLYTLETAEHTYDTEDNIIETITDKSYYRDGAETSKEISKTIYSEFIEIATSTLSATIENAFSLYPNPAQNTVSFNTNSNETFTIKAFNDLGTEIPVDYTNNTINVSDWNTGIYFLTIRTASGKNFTKKLMKQ